MNTKKHPLTLQIVISVLSTLFLLLGIYFCIIRFNEQNETTLEESNRAYIKDSTLKMKDRVDSTFRDSLGTLESMAYLFGYNVEVMEVDDAEFLSAFEKNGIFDYVRFIDTEGYLYTSSGIALDEQGNRMNSSERGFFRQGMQGKSGITYLEASKITKEPLILLYAPVMRNGNLMGLLLASFREESVQPLISSSYYMFPADTLLLTKFGGIFMSSTSEMFQTMLQNSDDPNSIESLLTDSRIFDSANAEIVRDAYTNGNEGFFHFNGANGHSYGYLVRLDTVNLTLGHTFPSSAHTMLLEQINSAGRQLERSVALVFVGYLLVLAVVWGFTYIRMRQKLKNQSELARTDGLTGIANRLSYEEELRTLDEQHGTVPYSIVALDVNYLKETNDTLGHLAGDELLIATAGLLQAVFSTKGKVFRTGGDEFAAIVYAAPSEAQNLLDRFRNSADCWQGKITPSLSVSCGLAHSFEQTDGRPNLVAAEADALMYKEKQAIHAGRT